MKTLLTTLALLTLPALVVGQSDTPRQVGPVLLIDYGRSVEMKYSMAGRRGSVSGIGVFTTAKQYLVFGGPTATLRTQNKLPTFEFYADSGLNVESAIYLIRFDMKSDRRQIRVGKARARSTSLGVPKDHEVASSIQEIGSGPNSTRQYRIQPTQPLRPGEYCLVRSGESCFDFGIDP